MMRGRVVHPVIGRMLLGSALVMGMLLWYARLAIQRAAAVLVAAARRRWTSR